MAKKKIKNKTTNIVSQNEITNLIKIIVIVCLVLLAFYFITLLVNKNSSKNTTNTDDTVAIIQYDKIIVGEILNRSEDEYYVLVEKDNDVNADLYKSYISIYSGKENAKKVYTVDLSDIFNSNHIGDETILNNGIENLKFSDTTLIKIKNGSISESLVGAEEIENYLKNLIN